MSTQIPEIVEAHAVDEMKPYERLLGDALEGDHTLFGSFEGIETSWRIVQPILDAPPPVQQYERGSWGPVEHRP